MFKRFWTIFSLGAPALFCLYDLACTLLLEKLYLDAKSPCVYTVYGRKISLRLVQLNLVSLGIKGNYKKGKEIFFAIVLLCILSCRKRPGCGSFLKCVVSNVILSIDAHTIVVAHYYSFVCYRNFSFIRTVK